MNTFVPRISSIIFFSSIKNSTTPSSRYSKQIERISYAGKRQTKNIELAVKKLKPLGFRLSTNLTLSKDNLSELGQFIYFFSKYFDDLFLGIRFI